MIKYPIGVQNFDEIILGDYTYVDKTSYVRSLVENGKIYFLGRPRRFGKSLLLSTMAAFFEGKRSLFKGLAIDKWDEWDWGEYPVLHIDLNAKDYTYKESLAERLNEYLRQYEETYQVIPPDNSLDGRFRAIIEKAYETTGRQVVVLIDEYDKPILDTLHDDSIKELHRDSLRAFYSVLKSSDKYLKFCFLTGVTKFGQLSIFSGLNNLNDISLVDEYAGICGITEDELHEYFEEGSEACAQDWGETIEDVYKNLKHYYDGYHFSRRLLDVYNPWSVLNAMAHKSLGYYWNASGGSMSFLYKLLVNNRIQLRDFDNMRCPMSMLQGVTTDVNNPIPVLYQAGYLTIKSFDARTLLYTLKYPNFEVATGFLEGLLPAYSGVSEYESSIAIIDFVSDVNGGDVEGFLERMQAFFAGFPYENALKTERDFQNVMYAVMAMMSLSVRLEQHSSRGSADMVIKTSDYVYIFEFKVNKSPEEALKQIEEKGYAEPFKKEHRKIIKVGVEFSTEARNITRWQIS